MKKVILVPVIAIVMTLCLATPVAASFYQGTPYPSLSPVFGTLVNFDDQPTLTPIAQDDYVSVGIASIVETEGLGTFARYSGSQSPPNYIGTGGSGERGTDAYLGWDGTIEITLAYPTNKIGIGVANNYGGPETVTIFDASGVPLEPPAVVPAGANVYVYFERTTYDINKFVIKGDYFAVDDLQFVSWDPNVEIDIKPGSDPNSINLKSNGVVPVAILTTAEFDAADVDPETVTLEGIEPVKWEMLDVPEVWDPVMMTFVGDSDLDLVLYFSTKELATVLDISSTEATLIGETFAGAPIQGTDSVRIVKV